MYVCYTSAGTHLIAEYTGKCSLTDSASSCLCVYWWFANHLRAYHHLLYLTVYVTQECPTMVQNNRAWCENTLGWSVIQCLRRTVRRNLVVEFWHTQAHRYWHRLVHLKFPWNTIHPYFSLFPTQSIRLSGLHRLKAWGLMNKAYPPRKVLEGRGIAPCKSSITFI